MQLIHITKQIRLIIKPTTMLNIQQLYTERKLKMFLIFLLCFLGGTLGQQDQPNIILIIADDLGFNDVSWHNQKVLTPNLDSLARFEHYSLKAISQGNI